MKLRFLREALDEYDATLDYYVQRSEEAARAFAAEFEAAVEQILASPLRWRREGDKARIYRLPNFPYSLFYRPEDKEVILLAAAHNRREPGYWRGRALR